MTKIGRDIDKLTGVETTGHEWDGIKELNKPLPKWWLLTFYATILWAVAYWIVYPAWPTFSGYTRGVIGYSQRKQVAQDVVAARSAQSRLRDRLAEAKLESIRSDPDLQQFAIAAGASAFQNNCAPCHGRGAQGFVGYPNLNDDDWLWGGTLDEIYNTIRFGIRSEHSNTHSSQMPRFGVDKLLEDSQINDVVEFLLSLSRRSTDGVAVSRGEKLFGEQCAACHGAGAKGKQAQGAPNLSDAISLYGDSKQALLESVRTGRGGSMPAWAGRLDPATIKALAVYVHGLGGGK